MNLPILTESPVTGCSGCAVEPRHTFDFSMAFQPIVDVARGAPFAFEALVRGTSGQGALDVLSRVNSQNRYWFDQQCRVKAITLAHRLGIDCVLSINFLPNAVYEPENCLRATLEAARRTGLPARQLMFEITESEQSRDVGHLRGIFTEYKRQGFITAIDDFGAGYAGLNLLADLQPDMVKLDMALVRGIESDATRRALVRAMTVACQELHIGLIAEGVETPAEAAALSDLGVTLMQGYLFARPAFERLPLHGTLAAAA